MTTFWIVFVCVLIAIVSVEIISVWALKKWYAIKAIIWIVSIYSAFSYVVLSYSVDDGLAFQLNQDGNTSEWVFVAAFIAVVVACFVILHSEIRRKEIDRNSAGNTNTPMLARAITAWALAMRDKEVSLEEAKARFVVDDETMKTALRLSTDEHLAKLFRNDGAED